MTPEEILKIASDNGFDWWGRETPMFYYLVDEGKNIEYSTHGKTPKQYDGFVCREILGSIKYSLADIATNKSFLEALYKIMCKNNNFQGIGIAMLQMYLVNDLTNNNGKVFWQICSDFITPNGKGE